MMVRRAGQATSDTLAILPDGSRVRIDGPSIVLDDEGIAEYCAERDREIEALLADIDAPVVGLQVCGGLADDANDRKGDPAQLAAMIAAGRASLQIRRQRDEEAKEREKEARTRAIASRPTTPRPAPLSEAERKKLKRDQQHAAKIAAAPAVDHEALTAEFHRRRDQLEARLSVRPLPPKLRPHVGKATEYAAAWHALECARGPAEERRTGRPATMIRAGQVFDGVMGLPPGTTTPDAMKRKRKVVEFLEAEVWGLRPTPEGC